mgnify:CR=1 FL=1
MKAVLIISALETKLIKAFDLAVLPPPGSPIIIAGQVDDSGDDDLPGTVGRHDWVLLGSNLIPVIIITTNKALSEVRQEILASKGWNLCYTNSVVLQACQVVTKESHEHV